MKSNVQKKKRKCQNLHHVAYLLPLAALVTLTQRMTEVLVRTRLLARVHLVFFIVTQTKFIANLKEKIIYIEIS